VVAGADEDEDLGASGELMAGELDFFCSNT
jgi:hypothetical protein